MVVSPTRAFHSADSLRNADLLTIGTDQDRHFTKHDIPPDEQLGLIHRLLLAAAGRAGDCWAPKEIILHVTDAGGGDVKAKDF